MQVYTTEEEQLQYLLNWFKKYGVSLVVTFCAVIAVIFSWNYWHSYNATYVQNASNLYEEFQKAKSDPDQIKIADELVKKYKSSIYGKTAAIYLTNKKILAKQWPEAVAEYEILYRQTKSWPDLQIVVFENLVRAKIEAKQLQSASDDLEQAKKYTNFVKLYPLNFYNLMGDLLAKQNKNEEALATYNLALDVVSNKPAIAQQMAQVINWITLKRNDLLVAKPLG